jgi:hypothetical protein
MRVPNKSYTARIPIHAAEIPVLFGRGSARRSISAIPTITATTTIFHALVHPDNGDHDPQRNAVIAYPLFAICDFPRPIANLRSQARMHVLQFAGFAAQ